jgi:hypothetical protein
MFDSESQIILDAQVLIRKQLKDRVLLRKSTENKNNRLLYISTSYVVKSLNISTQRIATGLVNDPVAFSICKLVTANRKVERFSSLQIRLSSSRSMLCNKWMPK